MSERDLAEAIHHEIISPESVDAALDLWNERPHRGERDRMWFVLAATSEHAIEAVLARRLREAARTGPWDAPCPTDDVERARDLFLTWMRTRPGGVYQSSIQSTEATRLFGMIAAALRDERERCARHIEARAVALRDNGPTTPEGVLTGIAGAQVGALLDAAASLRTGRGDAP